MKYKINDILVNQSGTKQKVIEVFTQSYLLENTQDGVCTLYSEKKLDAYGYTLKSSEEGEWIPEEGEDYFIPHISGGEAHYYISYWDNDETDNLCKSTIGIYRTKEEAIAKAGRILETIKGLK